MPASFEVPLRTSHGFEGSYYLTRLEGSIGGADVFDEVNEFKDLPLFEKEKDAEAVKNAIFGLVEKDTKGDFPGIVGVLQSAPDIPDRITLGQVNGHRFDLKTQEPLIWLSHRAIGKLVGQRYKRFVEAFEHVASQIDATDQV